MSHENREKKDIDPKDNVITISNYKSPLSYIFLTKIFLRKFQNVELHALGEAVKTGVTVAQNMQKQGFVQITSIQTFTYEQDQKDNQRAQKKIKLIVALKVTPEGQTKIEEELQQRKNQQK